MPSAPALRICHAGVGDQLADHARLRVHDQSAGLGIAGAALRILEHRIGDRRERLQRRAEGALARREVVVGAGDFAQAERQQGIDRFLAGLGHLDLGQDVIEIETGELDGHEEVSLG